MFVKESHAYFRVEVDKPGSVGNMTLPQGGESCNRTRLNLAKLGLTQFWLNANFGKHKFWQNTKLGKTNVGKTEMLEKLKFWPN